MSLVSRLLTRNVGPFDRVLRAIPAAIVAMLWATGMLNGTTLIVLGVLAAMLLATAITARCSIYTMLGWSTCPDKNT